MKKLLSILAMALCFVACQNDGVENVSNSDLVDVVLTVDAPELGITRADGDLFKGKSSAYGAIDFMNDADWEGYDLRYILEVYAEDDTNGANGMIYSERLVNCLDKYAETTFALRLVPGRTYKFVVFADFVAEGNAERTEPADKLAIADLYYNTADLRNISAITTEQTWGAMNEVRDAYFVSENVEITTNLTKKLTLTRPFAKLRVITTDLSYIKGYTAPGYVEITYKNEPIYKSFNAVNGELNTDSVMTGAELTYGYEVSKTTPYTDGYDSNPTNQTLFTDYLLAVDDEQTPVNFEMTVYESKGGRKIYSHDFNTQIPIERNHLTTIVGDLLTTQANITIEINDNFDEKEYVIGWGDENNIVIEENKWGNGEYVDGKYQFLVEAEGDEFTVNVNAAAVKNGALDAATYIWADDAQEGTTHTFSVEGLKANETTRALVDVEVLGGRMHVQSMDNNYKVLLNLVVKFSETDIRNTVYEYNGPITFGKILEAPAVTAVAEGNTVTVSWTEVEGATSYFVAMGDAEAEETQELSKVYTDLAWETEYTFSVKAVADGVESVAATATATTEAEPKPEARTITVYSTNTEVEQVYIYTWAEDGTPLTGEWPGTAMTVAAEQTEPNHKTFTYIFGAEYDGKVVNFIFNNGQGGEGNQTEDLKGKVLTEDLTFYVTLNAVAVQPEPEPTDAPEYQVAIPEGYTTVIFVRMNPASTENNWDNKWNQTGDLSLADLNGNNWFTPSGWDSPTTTWSKFEAGVDGYLYFTPSEWSSNNARFAAYFFGNGEKWVDLETYTPAVEPEEPEEPEVEVLAEIDANAYYIFKQATEMKGGKWYAIVSDTVAAKYISSDYGWLYTANTIARSEGISLPAMCAFGFLTTDGGYTMQQYDGKYLYMKGTYNNFNVSAELPEAGGIWTVENIDGAYTITNVEMQKYIQYASNFSSFGSYNTESGVLPTLYELVEVDNTPMILSVAPSALSFSADGESKTSTIETYGSATINVSDNVDWVETSLVDNVLTVTAAANSGAAREAVVTITYGDDSTTIAVSQAEYKEDTGDTPETPENTIGVYTSMDFLFKDKTITNANTGQTQGTNAYKQAMNDGNGGTIDVLKLGTSSKAGEFETAAVGVSDVSKLSFYAVGWAKKTVKLTVTVDGVATELSLTANAGATGNPPYNNDTATLEFSDDTDYYTIDVTGISATSTVKFATDSTGCRALICGVQLY